TIANRVNARLPGAVSPGVSFLFVVLPGILPPYRQAIRRAAAAVGDGLGVVYDLAALRPNRIWGALSSDLVHPNDAGHKWIADTLAVALDPDPTLPRPSTAERIVIDAATV